MQVLTSLSGLPISAGSAGYAPTNSADVSAIASAYVESAVSGKQDSLTFAYNAESAISSINGSALAGQGGGVMITSIQSARNPWYQTSISGLNGSSLYPNWAESAEIARNAISAGYATEAGSAGAAPTAWASSFITGVSSPSGTIRVLSGTAIESTNSAVMPSTVIEGFSTSFGGATIGPGLKANYVFPTANPSTEIIVPLSYNPGVVLWSSDNGIEGSQAKGDNPETITVQVPNATAVDIWSDSWIPVNSVTASAATQEIGGGVGELAWASALPTYSYDAENKISGINGSAIAGGAGGVDSATVSSIASSYAESAASGKLDASASSSFYTTANESGFITGVDLSPYQTTAGMSGYIPTSMSSDFQPVTGMSSYALSSDVSATVDLVGTQSANWGGSALQLSAGPGVKLEKSGNVLVASTDETVLWESNVTNGETSATLSGSIFGFESFRVFYRAGERYGAWLSTDVMNRDLSANSLQLTDWFINASDYMIMAAGLYTVSNDGLTLSGTHLRHMWFDPSNFGYAGQGTAGVRIYKVVGINRTAEA